ncbi:hypothetical protein CspHIS471_0501840 [Cutaneotrichosporon sp. HIS471]|nr:hypothetical protein CspHIS471_0501840 [Cutaneotrichosporon sp. HIS471]
MELVALVAAVTTKIQSIMVIDNRSLASSIPGGYNASYELLLLVFLQAMLSGTRLSTMSLGYGDNTCPRQELDRMALDVAEGKGDARVVAKLQRRQAAHYNCIEGLGIFCAAIVAGNTAGLEAWYMNMIVCLYVLLRTVYVLLYINTTTGRWSILRSGTWIMCNVCWIVTVFRAGHAMNEARRR